MADGARSPEGARAGWPSSWDRPAVATDRYHRRARHRPGRADPPPRSATRPGGDARGLRRGRQPRRWRRSGDLPPEFGSARRPGPGTVGAVALHRGVQGPPPVRWGPPRSKLWRSSLASVPRPDRGRPAVAGHVRASPSIPGPTTPRRGRRPSTMRSRPLAGVSLDRSSSAAGRGGEQLRHQRRPHRHRHADPGRRSPPGHRSAQRVLAEPPDLRRTLDVIGLSFPGVPGFPHFGHNAEVAWCITHGMADDQDLFVERLATWTPAASSHWPHRRRVACRVGSAPRPSASPAATTSVTLRRHRERADRRRRRPDDGVAIALRWTATAAPDTTVDALVPHDAGRFDRRPRRGVRPVGRAGATTC